MGVSLDKRICLLACLVAGLTVFIALDLFAGADVKSEQSPLARHLSKVQFNTILIF